MEHLKRLNRELKYKGNILDFYEDTILVPNGNVVHWDFLKHNGAAAVVAVKEDGRILMVRQYRNALDRETLEIPAGSLNSTSEQPIVAAARELEEETGYRCQHIEPLLSLVTTVAFCDETIDVFLAKDLVKTHQNLDEDEYVEVEEYTMNELLNMIYSGKIQDSKTVAALLAYNTKNIHLH